MRRLLSNRFFAVGLVALAILIPLNMISGLIQERQQVHRQAIDDMSATSTVAQQIIGPVLVIPCRETYKVDYQDQVTRSLQRRDATRDCTRYALPTTLTIKGALDSDIRSRGIHDALFYTSDLAVQAQFRVPERFGSGEAESSVVLGSARLGVGVRDTRGILNVPSLLLEKRKIDFAPGAALPVLGNGIHAELGEVLAKQVIDVAFAVQLRGLEELRVVPLGRQTEVQLTSRWPHPSFIGRFLPTTRQISARGFDARWSTSQFSTGLDEIFNRHFVDASTSSEIDEVAFGVTLMDPVNLYTQSDRATKYAFLFVALTFIALLGTELARGLHLHPMQYTMVGVALAMFFLMLLSLAEHIGFDWAYALAATSCISLLGYYLRHTLRSLAIGSGFVLTLSTLYGLLYGLLDCEDYALLAGSVFVFAVLALLMVVTRKVDWFTLLTPAVTQPVGDSTSA
jgi:inner membrane protein